MYKAAEKSYAKINIALNITNTRDDGYHELDMIMVPLKFHDSVQISELKGKKDNFVVMDDFSIKLGHTNIAETALKAVLSKTQVGDKKFLVFIHKLIPVQAGLGGGSSNAAATMRATNRFLKLNIPDEELLELSKPIGSDVPFFIQSKPARCRGRGEKLEPINIKNNYHVIIVKAEEGCSTKEIYDKFDKMYLPSFEANKTKSTKGYNTAKIDNVIKALEEGDDALLEQSMGNSLQDPACELVPEIRVIIDKLKSKGLKLVMMTGSGSAVFGMSTDKKLIKRIAKEIEAENENYFVEVTEVLK